MLYVNNIRMDYTCGAGVRPGIDSACSSFCLPTLVSFLPYSVGTTATFLSFFEYVAPLLPISLAASSFHSSARASVFFAAPTCDGSSDMVIDSKSWTTGVVPMSSPSVINNRHLSVRGERERHGQRAIEQTWYLASRVVWSATGPGPLLRGRRGHRAAH
jgi:hypothetical protein